MKRVIIVLGFLCGVAATLVLLVKNPLAATGVGSVDGPGTYNWVPLEFAGNAFAPPNLLGKSAYDLSDADDDALGYASAAILLVQEADGQPVALATRLTAIAKDGNLLQGNVGVDTYTNLFWPNRGSIMMYGHENRWPLISREALAMLGQAADTDQADSYLVSVDSTDDSSTGVVGGSGVWTGVGGRYQEVLTETDDQPGIYTGRIAVQLQNY